jgi:hypothetical protein
MKTIILIWFILLICKESKQARCAWKMMARSEQCNGFTKFLIAAGRARQHHRQCKGQHKERDNRSDSGGMSGVLGGFHPLHERRCALRFKASAVTTQSLLYQEWMCHGIPEEPARRDSTLVPPSASMGPLKNMDASSPARKAHTQEIHQQATTMSH